jgi:undecaprenyl-diphosphatase
VIDSVQAFWLALVQGLTEFLPISSSAHRVLPSLLLGWPDQGLAFDVAVHVGTLLAVLAYYRQDVLQLIVGGLAPVLGRPLDTHGQLAWMIVLATIPAGLVGLFAGDFIEQHLRTLPVIATTTLVFGLLLGLADRYRPVGTSAAVGRITVPIAMAIGLAQALAPVPGVSRSGVTITAGLFLGLDRQLAAKFSFLMSIPIIASAGGLKTLELAQSTVPVDWQIMLFGVAVAAITAYLCIAVFMRVIERLGMMPFVYYRCVLAVVLFYLWLS